MSVSIEYVLTFPPQQAVLVLTAITWISGKRYSELGGVVQYIGKPYSAVYDACMSVLAVQSTVQSGFESTLQGTVEDMSDIVREGVDKSRVCGVGDSLDHDILGAQRAGISSVWTANGVHSQEMEMGEGAPLLAGGEVLEGMYERYQVRPTHTIAAFKW